MRPVLAACIYAAFIVWLFRRYSKLAAPMSPGLWVAFAWLAIISSRPVGYWFATGSTVAIADPLGGSFIDRNTYLFLIILGVIVLGSRRIDWHATASRNRWLWIFYFYLLLSVAWSDYSFVAFKRWFKDVGNLVMVLIILTERDPVEAIRGVFVRCGYLLIPVSVLFIKYFPELGRYTNRWTYNTIYCGVTTNKNSLGLSAMICGLFLIWSLVDHFRYRWGQGQLRKAWPDLLILLMCIWLLKMAQSATSSSCFVIGTIIFFGSRLNWVKWHRRQLGWCGFGVGLVLLAFTTMPDFRGLVAGALGRDATLTGRTEIWKAVLGLGTNPLIGSGFASTWLTPKGAELAEALRIPHSHDGYLETYLHSGWIGVGLLLMVLLSAGRSATRQLSHGTVLGNLFMALFLIGLLYNYTEVAFNDSNILGFALWLMAAQGGELLAGYEVMRKTSGAGSGQSQALQEQELAATGEAA